MITVMTRAVAKFLCDAGMLSFFASYGRKDELLTPSLDDNASTYNRSFHFVARVIFARLDAERGERITAVRLGRRRAFVALHHRLAVYVDHGE